MKGSTKKTLLMAALALTLGVGAGTAMAATNTVEGHHGQLKDAKVTFVEAADHKSAHWKVEWKCDLRGHTDTFVTEGNTTQKVEVPDECEEPMGRYYWVETIKEDNQDKIIRSDVVPKKEDDGAKILAHDWQEDTTTVVKMATCEEGGTKKVDRHCKKCGVVEKGVIVETDKIGHKWTYTYEALKNVTLEGTNVEKPKATLVDIYQDGSYVLVATCGNGDHHVGTNPVKTTVVVKANTDNEGETKLENFVNVEIRDNAPALIDCTKKGTYDEVTYSKDGKTVLRVASKEIEAQHYPGKPVGENPTKNVVIDYDKDGNLVVVNKSCQEVGYYDKVVYCTNPHCVDKKGKATELSRERIEVAKSTVHTPSKKKTYENSTATCLKDGVQDEVTWCAICGVEMGRKQVKAEALGHDPAKPVVENEKKATAHKPGYYESVVYCKRCGDELDRKAVTVDPLDPDHYNWKYTLRWEGNADWAGSENKGYVFDWNDNSVPEVRLYAVPTDDDLTPKEIKELSGYLDKLEGKIVVTRDKSKDVIGNKCNLGSATFDAKIDVVLGTTKDHEILDKAGKNADAVKIAESETYKMRSFDYKGHQWSKWTNSEDGKMQTRTCDNCGEVETRKNPDYETPEEERIDISGAKIENLKKITYRGEYSPIPYKVTLDGKKLTENVDFVFTNTQKNEFKVVGSHKVTIAGIGEYKGTAKGKLYIDPAKQKIKVSLSKKTFKASALKKKAASFQITVKNAKGKVTYTSKNKKVTVSKKGKVTLKKGLKAGKYKITVKAAATKNYKAASKTVTFTVK